MDKKKILIIEDNLICQKFINKTLIDVYETIIISTKKEAQNFLKNQYVDMILLDIALPDSTGLSFLESLVKHFSNTPIIIITEEENPDIAAEIIKLGAKDYIRKSKFYKNPTLVKHSIANILQAYQYKKINEAQSIEIAYLNNNIFVPDTPAYQNAYTQATTAIKGNFPLLICGKTGSGKNIFARNIHQELMPKKPLITIDCGSIPDDLIESELFGYEKGSFTDATRNKLGKIELANEGLLFLDEIANASLVFQQKLLRVLQEKRISRLGSNKEISVNFMLITASNKNLLELIDTNKFREDLFYRIKQIEISLPSLHNNIEALKQFSINFINIYSKKYSFNFKPNKSFWDMIYSKKWPGNIRELDHEIQRIIFMKSIGENNEIYFKDQPTKNYKSEEFSILKAKHTKQEKDKILNNLERNNYNISATAREMGIPRTTLQNKLK